MDSQQGFYCTSSNDYTWEVVDIDGGSDISWEDLAEFSDCAGDDGNASEDVDNEYCDGKEELDKKHYTILKAETMKHLQQNDITEVFEEWFAGDERSRAAVGIPAEKKPRTLEESYCGICTKTVGFSGALSDSCDHLFCRDCWENYAAAVAGLNTVETAAAAAEEKCRFDQSLHRSDVESSRDRKWCPRPGCGLAVEFEGGGGGDEETYKVTCDCGYKFCWRCAEEQHHRVGCDEVVKWTKKNSSGAADQINTWILTLICTKSCPKCDERIEKTQGSNHVKCGACNHEFCWFCLHK